LTFASRRGGSAESPTGVDEASGVAALGVGVLVDGVARDACRAVPGGFGALGGVLGEVAGHHRVRDVAAGVEGDGADVDLVTPRHRPPVGSVEVSWRIEGGRTGRLVECVVEVVECDSGRRCCDGRGVVRVDAVEADEGVGVDGAASLHLGGLAV
jgi:hypothetical protein